MPFTQDTKGSRTFVNIIGGRFAKRVDASTEGASAREYISDKKTGAKKTVHELYYKDFSGTIKNVDIESGDYGDQIKIDFSDMGEAVTITLPLSSREGKSFLQRLPNINLQQEITLAPYNFIPKGEVKSKIGMNVFQGQDREGKPIKVNWYFTKENPNGLPMSTEEQLDADEFKSLMLQQDIFLKKFTKKFIAEKFGTQAAPAPSKNEVKSSLNQSGETDWSDLIPDEKESNEPPF